MTKIIHRKKRIGLVLFTSNAVLSSLFSILILDFFPINTSMSPASQNISRALSQLNIIITIVFGYMILASILGFASHKFKQRCAKYHSLAKTRGKLKFSMLLLVALPSVFTMYKIYVYSILLGLFLTFIIGVAYLHCKN